MATDPCQPRSSWIVYRAWHRPFMAEVARLRVACLRRIGRLRRTPSPQDIEMPGPAYARPAAGSAAPSRRRPQGRR